ncbi:hypothetical protein KIPB_004986, partial [Kipferlia bialata]|eukprot:g4986.t1
MSDRSVRSHEDVSSGRRKAVQFSVDIRKRDRLARLNRKRRITSDGLVEAVEPVTAPILENHFEHVERPHDIPHLNSVLGGDYDAVMKWLKENTLQSVSSAVRSLKYYSNQAGFALAFAADDVMVSMVLGHLHPGSTPQIDSNDIRDTLWVLTNVTCTSSAWPTQRLVQHGILSHIPTLLQHQDSKVADQA